MTVADVLPYFQLVSQIALVFAAAFAGYQLIIHRRERHEQAALGILTRLQSPEFQSAYTDVWELPVGASAAEVREHGRAMTNAAETVAMTFEVLGVMVHGRMVPLKTVDDVIGGFLRESWRRLEAFIMWKREQTGSPRLAEWYQWLAEQAEVDHKRRLMGAYEAFKDWKP